MTRKNLFYWSDGILKKLDADEIVFIEAAKNYIKCFLLSGSAVLVRSSLEKALKQLPSDQFVRIHRSYIASVDFIKEIRRDTVTFTADDEAEIPVSRQHYPMLKKKIKII